MKIVKTIAEVRDTVAEAKKQGKKVGLVPTMGALHAGHMSLIETGRKDCDFVVVTLFVNPAQFGPTEDIDRYPRTFDDDIKKCSEKNVDVVFAPSNDEMYPVEQLTWINVEKLSEPLCGANRRGHFRGVATVCAKLFNIVTPDVAFFGQKDAQQAVIIKRMVADLNMPLKIVICPTIREKNGLAMSSRNKYLSADEKKRATLLYAALQECEIMIANGVLDSKTLTEEMRKLLHILDGIEIDYISIVDAENLHEVDTVSGRVLVAIAARIGSGRLIDNITIDVDSN